MCNIYLFILIYKLINLLIFIILKMVNIFIPKIPLIQSITLILYLINIIKSDLLVRSPPELKTLFISK